jgi:signal transduction histidine kinase
MMSPSVFEGRNLAMALHRLAQRVRSVFDVECRVELNGDLPSLPAAAPAHLFKIAQEALTNGIKHAKARHLSIRVRHEGPNVVLSIWNDGLPFPKESAKKGRMGMRIMHYRAHVVGGSLEVKSGEQGGTVVSCSVPLDPEAKAASEMAVGDARV